MWIFLSKRFSFLILVSRCLSYYHKHALRFFELAEFLSIRYSTINNTSDVTSEAKRHILNKGGSGSFQFDRPLRFF